jgi:4'-phosphopantetheinyl transferase
MDSRRVRVLPLEDDLIQVWVAHLNCSAAELAAFESVLAADEHKRAAKFVFARDRHAYTAARGMLRHILAQYTGFGPEELVFETNRYGKPFLHPDFGGTWLHFNVSHSGRLALYAIRAKGEVGVDIEQMRPLDDLQTVAENTFSRAENMDLQSVPAQQYEEAFFTCWTRKEAFIKAIGQGLSFALQDFDVTLRPGEPARIRRIRGAEPGGWSLFDLRPAAGYVAAVAVPAPTSIIQWGWWSPVQNSMFQNQR